MLRFVRERMNLAILIFLIPIMSIPHRLQICEPFFEKPYLHAEKRLKTNWVDRFSNPSPKVGLAWRGILNLRVII